jgi:hypothetical protein
MLQFFTYFFSQQKRTKPFLNDDLIPLIQKLRKRIMFGIMYGIMYGIMFTGILNTIFFLNAFRKKSLFC